MTVTTQANIRSDLAALAGEEQVRFDEATRLGFMVDGILPQLAVFPSTAGQVAGILQYAGAHGLSVIPIGYGTKLATGAPPRAYDIALSLRSLRRVIHYEPADLTIGVEAGMSFQDLQTLIGKNNLWLPLDPRGGGASSIGGIIAANAAGPLRQGYGGPRDMVIGLTVATIAGTITKSGGKVVKNVAGYDFMKLFTGSMGTLGVMVEANLKLFPKPATRATFALKVAELDIARNLRRELLRSPLDPMRLVLLDAPALELIVGKTPAAPKSGFELWIELGGSHRVIERCMLELRQVAAGAGAVLERRDDSDILWEKISDLARSLQEQYHDLTVLKAAMPIAALEQFLRQSRQAAEAASLPLASFAQVGLGVGHLALPQERLSDRTAALVLRLRKIAEDLRGTLVIEHAPRELKAKVDVWGAHSDDVAAMRKIKSVWDPAAVLSPGRFVDGI